MLDFVIQRLCYTSLQARFIAGTLNNIELRVHAIPDSVPATIAVARSERLLRHCCWGLWRRIKDRSLGIRLRYWSPIPELSCLE